MAGPETMGAGDGDGEEAAEGLELSAGLTGPALAIDGMHIETTKAQIHSDLFIFAL